MMGSSTTGAFARRNGPQIQEALMQEGLSDDGGGYGS